MPTLRALRTLNAVESGTLDATSLNTRLTEIGHLAEFTSLLSDRGQTRRMASNALTMTAIAGSVKAHTAVFGAASSENSTAASAVVTSSTAMTAISINLPTLNVVGGNPTSWSLFRTSDHFESNVHPAIATYINVSTGTYPTTASIIDDDASMALVAGSVYAMNTMVASPTSTTLMAADAVAMGIVAGDSTAIGIVAAETAIMPIIAASSAAMTEIVLDATATATMAAAPGAIQAIGANPTAWTAFKGAASFAANLKVVIANLVGLTPSAYVSLDAMVLDATAFAAITTSTQALEAVGTSSATLTTIANDTAAATAVINSSAAMATLGTDAFLTDLLGNSALTSTIFSSSAFKGLIMNSTTLVDAIAANGDIITFLTASSITAMPASTRSSASSSDDPFDGAPSKLLSLYFKGNTIVATTVNFDFDGSPAVGTGATGTVALAGTFTTAHVAGYTDMTWSVAGIAATVAASPIMTYYDMT
jgi:hypothetical protein